MKRLLVLSLCCLLLCSCNNGKLTETTESAETDVAMEKETLATTEYYISATTDTETSNNEKPENICYYCNLNVKDEVNNGIKYYSIEGLRNDEIKMQVDEFINKSFEEMGKFVTQGNVAVTKCCIVNGYLSVICAYTDGVMPEMGSLGEFSDCRTAVFDIIEHKRIEAFDELFPEDFDFGDYQNPDYFTATSYITGSERKCEYSFPEYWNIYTLTLKPRDFSDYVTVENKTYELPMFYTSFVCKQYKDDSLSSMYVVGSRFLSEKEIQEKNKIYETVENAMYELFNNNRSEAEKYADIFLTIFVEEKIVGSEKYYIASIGAFNAGTVSRAFHADGSVVYLREIEPQGLNDEAVVSDIVIGHDGSVEAQYSTNKNSFDCNRMKIAE